MDLLPNDLLYIIYRYLDRDTKLEFSYLSTRFAKTFKRHRMKLRLKRYLYTTDIISRIPIMNNDMEIYALMEHSETLKELVIAILSGNRELTESLDPKIVHPHQDMEKFFLGSANLVKNVDAMEYSYRYLRSKGYTFLDFETEYRTCSEFIRKSGMHGRCAPYYIYVIERFYPQFRKDALDYYLDPKIGPISVIWDWPEFQGFKGNVNIWVYPEESRNRNFLSSKGYTFPPRTKFNGSFLIPGFSQKLDSGYVIGIESGSHLRVLEYLERYPEFKEKFLNYTLIDRFETTLAYYKLTGTLKLDLLNGQCYTNVEKSDREELIGLIFKKSPERIPELLDYILRSGDYKSLPIFYKYVNNPQIPERIIKLSCWPISKYRLLKALAETELPETLSLLEKSGALPIDLLWVVLNGAPVVGVSPETHSMLKRYI